jgi:non-ribosomal peptide synthetase component E (peptide arylation enzyme)
MMFERNEMIELLQKERTLAETIMVRAERLPDHTAIVFNNEKITYRQLNDKIDSLAAAFLRMGIGAKDRIAVILPTRPEFLYVWYVPPRRLALP